MKNSGEGSYKDDKGAAKASQFVKNLDSKKKKNSK